MSRTYPHHRESGAHGNSSATRNTGPAAREPRLRLGRDPAAGAIRYRGGDVRTADVLALRRGVALVPQLPALLESTVAENVR